MILVLVNAHLKARATLLHPTRRLATVCLDQASNIANAVAFGDDPRLSENPGGQLRNCRRPLCKSLIYLSNTSVAPESPDRQMIGIQNNHYRARGVRERRYALPASMISSKRGSFLNLPASRFHHGCWDTFRTAFNSDLIFRSSRSRTVTRCSNFVAVDCMALSLCGREYTKREREESPLQRGVGGVTKGQAVTYTLSDGKKIQKVTEVVTGTGSVVRAVSFHHR